MGVCRDEGSPFLGRGPGSPSHQCSASPIHAIDRENQSPVKILYHSFVYLLTQLTPIRCAQVNLGRGSASLFPHLKACSFFLQTPMLKGWGCHISLALLPQGSFPCPVHQAAHCEVKVQGMMGRSPVGGHWPLTLPQPPIFKSPGELTLALYGQFLGEGPPSVFCSPTSSCSRV